MIQPTETPPVERRRRGPLRRVLGALGPGVIAGAADDDPSGIATYSIAGAQLGTRMLWCSLLTWPLMGAVQMMCARIGMVTGRGLASGLRAKLPRGVLVFLVTGLLVANTVNVGADLSGMADAGEMLTGVDSHSLVVLFAVGIGWATIRLRYSTIARTLKWLAAALFAYVVTMVHVKPDWGAVIGDTFIPSWPSSRTEWATLVAILGTTISPYLFFWQASQEVEEIRRIPEDKPLRHAPEQIRRQLRRLRLDTIAGMGFSNLIAFFMITATAATLHAHGQTQIQTTEQAAAALRPIAGDAAFMLFALGIVGTGMLALPVLAG
ncbi:MAG TPA: Nramp family divalent metal transporter, partial [Gemmatimonadales bacterium]|nr:Nramp family divalent metal transporter [Gemmatimonadales bacterium]